MHFQHSVAELCRHFRAIGIFGQREAASEVTKGARNLIRKSNGNVSFVGLHRIGM